jgi:hypothetical protein
MDGPLLADIDGTTIRAATLCTDRLGTGLANHADQRSKEA